jgi:hypothetical protein
MKNYVLLFLLLLICNFASAQNYKDLDFSDKRVLNANIKAYGKVGNPEKIIEYAVYSVSQAKRMKHSISGNNNSVVLFREGWSWEHSNGQVTRIWNKTGPNGKIHTVSKENVNYWIGRSVKGYRINDEFPKQW